MRSEERVAWITWPEPVLNARGLATPRVGLLLLRLALGWLMFHAGWEKLVNPEGWTAAGFLTRATKGPFAGIFQGMGGNPVVDMLVMYGEVAIGLALILGLLTRWSAFWGAVMILLFYLAQLPPEHGWVSDKIIYIIGFTILAASRSGTYLGVDGFLERVQQRWPVLRYILS